MLEAIGVASIDELFEQIPAGVRFERALDVEPALTEAEIMRLFEELAGRNAHTGVELSFLGMGVYDHYVPAVVDVVMSRGEFLTAYTPYQPEMSQGVLQAIFEYQTAICELTGMDVSNASGYDGCTVAADACFIAKHATGRSKVVVAETRQPDGAPGREDVRARVRARGGRGPAPRRRHRSGRARPPRRQTRRPSSSSSRTSSACSRTLPRSRRPRPRRGRAAGRARRPDLARRARGAGRVRLRDRDRRGPGRGQLPELRRAALRLSRRPDRI